MIYDSIYSKDFDTKEIPHGWIQWKGTSVCMDVYCKCGYHGHVDAEFFYHYECPKCKTKYAVGQNIKMIELDEEQIKYLQDKGNSFETCVLDEEN